MAAAALGKMCGQTFWQSSLRVFAMPLISALLLASCAWDDGEAPKSMDEGIGGAALSEILRSDNADLITNAASDIASARLTAQLDEMRESEEGRALINAALATLNHATTPDWNTNAKLIARATLDPASVKPDAIFGTLERYEKIVPGPTDFVEQIDRELYEAAARVDQSPARWERLLHLVQPIDKTTLMLTILRLDIKLPPTKLLSHLAAEVKPKYTDSVYAGSLAAGAALLLLDDAKLDHPLGRKPVSDAARALASAVLGDRAKATMFIERAAAAGLTGDDWGAWLEAVSAVVAADRASGDVEAIDRMKSLANQIVSDDFKSSVEAIFPLRQIPSNIDSECARWEDEVFKKPDVLAATLENKIIGYATACQPIFMPDFLPTSLKWKWVPGDENLAHDLIMGSARDKLLPLSAGVIVEADRYALFSSNFGPYGALPESLYKRLLLDKQDTSALDYYRLFGEIMTGDPFRQVEHHDISRAALISRSDLVARWVASRVRDYDYKSASAKPAANFDDVVQVMLLAWESVDSSANRVRQAGAFHPADRSVLEAELAKYESTARNRISREVVFAHDKLCSGGDRQSACLSPAAAHAAEQLAKQAHAAKLSALASVLEQDLERRKPKLIYPFIWIVAAHAGLWLLLLLLYPLSATVQATIFWNPLVRKYAGLGYVHLALLMVPFFRNRIMIPFRDSLVAEGRLTAFDERYYFPEIPASRTHGVVRTRGRLRDLVPAIRGQIWIEAPSGAGKTWFLRELALKERRPVAFLNATSCSDGLVGAVASLCPLWGSDPDFLESLIFTGALGLIVDGLNEVDRDARAQIVSFVQSRKSCRVVMATQPTKTRPPSRAELISVEGLEDDQLLGFLRQQVGAVLQEGQDKQRYFEAVGAFVKEPDAAGVRVARDILRQLTSNPMDLHSVAELIAKGVKPDLIRLQEQQVDLACSAYAEIRDTPFPMEEVSNHLYELRLNNKALTLGDDEWGAEREALREGKLLQRIDLPNKEIRWKFRHDKISDYFLFRAFQYKSLFEAHLTDSRFLGVYVLLARHLSKDDADIMLNKIAWAAAGEEDWTVSQAFIETLRSVAALRAGTDHR